MPPSLLPSLARLFSGQAAAPARPRKPGIERETVELTLPDGNAVALQRVRDPRARRLKLSVDERGVRLSLPLRCSQAQAERFLHDHLEWVARQVAHYQHDDVTPLSPGDTHQLPLRGEAVPLHWKPARFARLQFDTDGALIFGAPDTATPASLQRAVRDFYEAQARADVGRWMPRYLPGLPRAPSRTRLRIMSSQWGSLAPDGAMTLDLSLVLARPSAFEYVLVHELCHLIHADHSRAFWREVAARFPNWRDERTYFHAEGRRLKAQLRALTGH